MLLMKNMDGMRRAVMVSDEEGAKMVKDGAATATYHSGIIEEAAEYATKEMTPAPKKRTRKKKDESAE